MQPMVALNVETKMKTKEKEQQLLQPIMVDRKVNAGPTYACKLTPDEIKAHSKIVRECFDFSVVWRDVTKLYGDLCGHVIPRGIYTVTPRQVTAIEVLTDEAETIPLVFLDQVGMQNGWAHPQLFSFMFALADTGDDFLNFKSLMYDRYPCLFSATIQALNGTCWRAEAFGKFLDCVDPNKSARRNALRSLIQLFGLDNTHCQASLMADKLCREAIVGLDDVYKIATGETRKEFIQRVGEAACRRKLDLTVEEAVRVVIRRVEAMTKLAKYLRVAA